MNQHNYPFGGGPDVPDFKSLYNKYRTIIIAGIVLIALIALGSASYFKVNPDEVGVITRFGKYIDPPREPGPHLRIPFVDEVKTIEAKRQLKLEFGFETNTAGVKSTFHRDANSLKESMMLTGDLNVAVVEWIVHYQINDPKAYLFKVRNSV